MNRHPAVIEDLIDLRCKQLKLPGLRATHVRVPDSGVNSSPWDSYGQEWPRLGSMRVGPLQRKGGTQPWPLTLEWHLRSCLTRGEPAPTFFATRWSGSFSC